MKSTAKTNDVLFNQMAVDQAVMLNEVKTIKTDVADIKDKLDREYATKEWVRAEYDQSKKLINGLASVILLAVVTALVALVVVK
jgi:hypothetical protein